MVHCIQMGSKKFIWKLFFLHQKLFIQFDSSITCCHWHLWTNGIKWSCNLCSLWQIFHIMKLHSHHLLYYQLHNTITVSSFIWRQNSPSCMSHIQLSKQDSFYGQKLHNVHYVLVCSGSPASLLHPCIEYFTHCAWSSFCCVSRIVLILDCSFISNIFILSFFPHMRVRL